MDENIHGNFCNDGYTIIRNLVNLNSVNYLRNYWLERCDSASPFFIVGNDLLASLPGTILPIIASDAVLELCEQLVGPFVQLDSVALVGVAEGYRSPVSWHRDPYASMPRGRAYQPPNSVHMLVYLQDMTDEVGPLRVIPGSHRRPLSITEKSRNKPHRYEKLLRLREGDGIIIHNKLLHSRSTNNSKNGRLHFSAIYNLTCMRSTVDWSLEGLASIAAQLRDVGDPRLHRLMGEDRFAEDRYNSGFLCSDEIMWARWRSEER